MRFKNYLLDKVVLKKKVWQAVDLMSLDEPMRHRLWDMYVDTYQTIGLHIESSKKLTTKYKVSWLIDIDKDPQPDAFIIYKETPQGKKLALMGSDGSKLSKSLLIKKTVKLLKTKGWFVEASHKVADIFTSKGVSVINDIELVKSIIGDDKFVEDLGNGEYKRKLGSLGVVKKRLFGTL